MVRPCVMARVEQPGEIRGIRVKAGDVRAFEPVAVRASEREIFFLNGLSAMLLSKNVVELKG